MAEEKKGFFRRLVDGLQRQEINIVQYGQYFLTDLHILMRTL